MKRATKVLIYPGGSENGLELWRSLKDAVNVLVCGASTQRDHGELVYPQYFNLPSIHASNFVAEVNQLIISQQIDMIIPTHDDVCVFLASQRAHIKALIATSDISVARICRSKQLSYQLFEDLAFCPAVYRQPVANPEAALPLFAKPDSGQGGKGSFRIDSVEQLQQAFANNLLVCEHLPGPELTVDCFSDFQGRLIFVGPRTRDRVFAGISARSSRQPLSDELQSIAQCIHDRLNKQALAAGAAFGLRGIWYFQLKQDAQGCYKLLEVSSRLAGAGGLYRQLGVNFALMAINDLYEIPLKVLCNPQMISADKCLENRFQLELDYQRVYLDFDDTVTFNTQTNQLRGVRPLLAALLYHWRVRGKAIVLLTRNANVEQELADYALAPALFEQIIYVPDQRPKSTYIQADGAIFVDNAFAERLEVSKQCQIPVFDVDAISCLFDWRVM